MSVSPPPPLSCPPQPDPPDSLHGTAVVWRGAGVLLTGPSGAGKSDLALRLVDRGWRLVADDRVVLPPAPADAEMTAPPILAGLLEVRGLGILRLKPGCVAVAAPLILAVDLLPPDVWPERLPEPASAEIRGHRCPRLALAPFEASASIKLELALARVWGDSRPR